MQTALVLFDIDGTLIRRAGPHHREALVRAIAKVTGRLCSTDGIAFAGMLDPQILDAMLRNAGAPRKEIVAALPSIMDTAQRLYSRSCPDLARKVCPGVRRLLRRLERENVVTGLVTGNLTRIAWKKLDRAGLRPYFRFGAFAESAASRAGLVRLAIRHARSEGWVGRNAPITLIGDHVNDILAARANRIRSVAVATGVLGESELEVHVPDILLRDLRSLAPEMLR